MTLRDELERVLEARDCYAENGGVSFYMELEGRSRDFMLTHGPALLEALIDAERYRWLKAEKIVRAHPMKALFKGETRILADATIRFNGDYTYVVDGSISDIDQAIDRARGGGE